MADNDENEDVTKSSESPIAKNPINWTGLWPSVRYQGECGSCWAFATVGAVEGVYAIANRQQRINAFFSPQHLVDCDRNNNGCNGGFPTQAMEFVRNYGTVPDSNYPYVGYKGSCRNVSGGIKIRTYSYCQGYNCSIDSWYNNLAKGPVVVGVQADQKLQNYRGGVLTYNASYEPCSQPNHAIIAVGWGTDQRLGDYIIIRNSWSTQWGEGGYGRIQYNQANKTCYMTAENWLPKF